MLILIALGIGIAFMIIAQTEKQRDEVLKKIMDKQDEDWYQIHHDKRRRNAEKRNHRN